MALEPIHFGVTAGVLVLFLQTRGHLLRTPSPEPCPDGTSVPSSALCRCPLAYPRAPRRCEKILPCAILCSNLLVKSNSLKKLNFKKGKRKALLKRRGQPLSPPGPASVVLGAKATPAQGRATKTCLSPRQRQALFLGHWLHTAGHRVGAGWAAPPLFSEPSPLCPEPALLQAHPHWDWNHQPRPPSLQSAVADKRSGM